MIEQVLGETTSMFSGAFMFALRTVVWLATTVLRIAFPIVLFGLVLASKSAILFIALLLVTLSTYWKNIGYLWSRIRAEHGAPSLLEIVRSYCCADAEELRFQSEPFSVADAVQNSPFYQRYISFVDTTPSGQVTIQNWMSLGWIAHVLDSGLTRIVKLAMPAAILISNLIFVPIGMVLRLFCRAHSL